MPLVHRDRRRGHRRLRRRARRFAAVTHPVPPDCRSGLAAALGPPPDLAPDPALRQRAIHPSASGLACPLASVLEYPSASGSACRSETRRSTPTLPPLEVRPAGQLASP